MIYKRSSFLTLLKEKYDCEIKVIGNGVIKIIHGSAHSFMHTDSKDRIDYEEVYRHYQKLWLPSLPTSSELELIE